MDFLNLARNRYSLRSFDGRPLSDGDIATLLEAARLAPTAKNLQPQKIFVLKSAEALEKLNACTPCGFGTKTAFLICYDKNVIWKRPFDGSDSGFVDAAIVATHIMLAATDIGVGTTMVMHFDPKKAVQAFELPENLVPVCFIVAGYPSANAAPSERHGIRKDVKEFTTQI